MWYKLKKQKILLQVQKIGFLLELRTKKIEIRDHTIWNYNEYFHFTRISEPVYVPLTEVQKILGPKFFCLWCGARLGGSKSNTVNLILRLFLYHFLHTMSSWRQELIHNNTNNLQTPPPWWWSHLPLQLQRHGFYESTLSKWGAALRIHFPRPLSKGLVKFNKLV